MSRRIDIELTSALGDGSWTWRAAGARQPKGVVDGSILGPDAKVGDELKVEIEQEIDGITILNVVHGRDKPDRADVIELLPVERDFKPVVETRAKRGPGERRSRDGDRRPRRDRGDRGDRGDRKDRGDRGDRGGRRDGGGGGGGEGRGGDGRNRGGGRGRRGPSFTPPPEVPQRPKPKRLRPGKQHRNEVLAELPEEQRAIAELTLQGMGAVRQRLREENEKAAAEGRALMPEASVMKMAEELLPKLRVAEWRDRAEAAQRQLEHLDLRDLRSVVAASGDPMVARDESTGQLIDDLRLALAKKQEEELLLWFGDVDAALAVGRVIRALRLSSQPPKAGVPFPTDIAQRLVESANASLAPMDSPERWSAMLEAAAFSPVHAQIKPARKPDEVNDDLLATVKRLAPALPHVAALFEIEVDPSAPMPKPMRPGPRKKGKAGKGGSDRPRRDRDDRGRSGDDAKGGSDRPKRDRDDRGRSGDDAKGGSDRPKRDRTAQHDAESADRTAAAPSDESAEAPSGAPAEAAAESPAEAPTDVADAPAERTAETSAEPTAETPAEPTDTAIEAPPEAPAPATTDTPADTPAEPTETAAETPAPATTETPAPATAETPAPATTETPAEAPAPATTDTPAEAAAEPTDTATDTAGETAAEPIDSAAETPAEAPTEPAGAAAETPTEPEAPADVDAGGERSGT